MARWQDGNPNPSDQNQPEAEHNKNCIKKQRTVNRQGLAARERYHRNSIVRTMERFSQLFGGFRSDPLGGRGGRGGHGGRGGRGGRGGHDGGGGREEPSASRAYDRTAPGSPTAADVLATTVTPTSSAMDEEYLLIKKRNEEQTKMIEKLEEQLKAKDLQSITADLQDLLKNQ